MIWIGVISGILFWILVVLPILKRQQQIRDANMEIFRQKMCEAIAKSGEESRLMNGNVQPTEEHILKYYKMYLKKKELARKEEWTTVEPMTFDEWQKQLNEYIEHGMNGYRFLISNTCDAMIGIPPNCTYQRFYDYEKAVEEDERKQINIKV